ncbi:5,6-dimethylbenzimidazole synthase [Puia dinghuensis]|uniref:5,6-dimethylbenzimidazole synthase n=2 Tax=Puia dinghuensis TaxID=1792502 RepID=A0A8J2UBM3_9BACT|nr:5,6-dimethylbenzimidazole synthase [Puia dinghuensis]
MELNGKLFTPAEAEVLWDVIRHRRDVRGNRFIDRPVEPEVVDRLLDAALHAPSVGFSQPWEFVLVTDRQTRQRVRDSFEAANAAAQPVFGEREDAYARLKLEGILEAPLNIAVFYVPQAGPVLGQTTMEEVGLYSVVCAVENMWLMARALNVGLGWVSILDPERVRVLLEAPAGHRLVAYLCTGYTDGFFEQPELELLRWEKRRDKEKVVRRID